MLVAKNIVKTIDSNSILKGIDIEIAKGEIVSIVGSSGAGKTTLLQIIGTLDKPSSGSITINSIDPFKLSSNELSAFRNKEIGFVFQFHQLLPEFTAIENIIMPALIGNKDKNQTLDRARELMEILGIEGKENQFPNTLSGGEQQRVAVARALINQPAIVFADEPSGNLDSKNAKELHELFFKLRDMYQQTFVIITHNLELANLADRKIQMADGQLV
ncbi:MAG: ABC transporter ATP-binding protein [Fluviicola sp.]